MTAQDNTKISADGRYVIFDSFGDEVERTDDLKYATDRADTNDGYVQDARRNMAVIYDSEDE